LFGDDKREIRFIRLLGKGGFGAVYLADSVSEGGLVQRMAVKILHDARGAVPEIAARARDEARLLSQVNHDNVVKVFGLTEVQGRVALLMEYVEGVDCAALLFASRRQGGVGLPPRVAARICECAASALHMAWSGISPETDQPLHIVHRDIKPTNILFSKTGAVKVMDFGVARGEIGREAVTAAWEYGTRRYMAPERILDGEAGARSDVYALGATFLELVSGVRFEALPIRREEFKRELSERVEEVRTLEEQWGVTGVSPALGHLLAYAPEDRLSAREAERLFASWGDALPGPELRRYASELVPPILEKRMNSPAADDELLGMSIGGPVRKRNSAQAVSKPREVQSPAWWSGMTQVLGVIVGLVLVVYGLQFRSADIAVRMATPEREAGAAESAAPASASTDAMAVPEEAPVLEVLPSAVDQELGAEKEKGSRRVEAPPVPPARVLEWVSVKVLADPREGLLNTEAHAVAVGERIELSVGEHDFDFRGPGWEVACTATLTPATKRIKFVKETGLCELR